MPSRLVATGIGLSIVLSLVAWLGFFRPPSGRLEDGDVASGREPGLLVVEPVERVPIPGTEISVRVLDSVTLDSIDGVRLEFVAGPSDGRKLVVTDAYGSASVPVGAVSREVRASNYLPDLGAIALESVREILLEPGSVLELHFTTVDGVPVPGIEVLLLPPIAEGQDWDAEWYRDFGTTLAADRSIAEGREVALAVEGGGRIETRASLSPQGSLRQLRRDRKTDPRIAELLQEIEWRGSSNESGVVTFETLPGRPGYRWGLVSPVHVDLVPPHEHLAPSREARRIVIKGRAPPLLSGRFDLEPGCVTQLEILTHKGATVRGRLEIGRALEESRGQVKLYSVTTHDRVDGVGYRENRIESVVTPGEDGTFVFDNARPGEKVLRAWRSIGPQEFAFVSRAFVVDPGRDVDLGTVRIASDNVFEGTVELVDHSGSRVTSESLFGVESIEAVLSITSRADSDPRQARISEQVAVRIGEPFRLVGIPSGKLWLRLTDDLPWPEPRHEPVEVRTPDTREFDIPALEPGRLIVEARTTASAVVQFEFPLGAPPARLEVWLRSLTSGSVHNLRTSSHRDVQQVEVTLNLSAGRYEMLVHSNTAGSMDASNVWGRTELDLVSDGQYLLLLHPAATVFGVVRGPDGSAVSDYLLQWTLEDWVESSPRIYRTSTDAEGRYTMRGIVPGARLVDARLGEITSDLVGGESREIDFVRKQ